MSRYDAEEAYRKMFALNVFEDNKRCKENTIWLLLKENFILGYLSTEHKLNAHMALISQLKAQLNQNSTE